MENINVQAQSRTVTGTKGAADVRREGQIPAIVYGDKDPFAVSVSLRDIRHAIFTPNFHLIDLNLDGREIKCIIKDVQFHPVTDNVIHIDFLQLVPGKKVKVEIPLRFEGISVGIKAGGKLMPKVRKVKIKAAPEHLVTELVLDVTELELGDSLRIRDIKAKEGIEVLNAPGIPVVSVAVPRALKSLESEAAKVAEGAEGEGEEGAAEGTEEGGASGDGDSGSNE